MNTMTKTAPFVAILFLVCILHAAEQTIPAPSDLLQTLDKHHPRLMLKDDRLDQLKQLYQRDKLLRKCLNDVLRRAEAYLDEPRLTYHKIGPRLLHVSRSCLRRVYSLALAYRWTGQEKYAEKALENILTVCEFKDWNPSHFLDTAEMSHAVGIGYDWLYHYLDPGTRRKIEAGLIKNGLEPGLRAYEKQQWWCRSEYNWNQVCNGGLIVGALAVADTKPDYARKILAAAIKSLPRALASYAPDGAWGEGPGYWSYATHYTAYGLAALQSALGTDFGLSEIQGLAQAGYFPIYVTGPTGLFLNFADSGERNARRPMPCMFWLARTFGNPLFAEDERRVLATHTAGAEHVVWYVPASSRVPGKALDRRFRGPVETAVFRSAWDDPQALFVGIKAGYNQVNHGHLDLGNFELDALGVRWARDLGSDNYNLPGYWNGRRGGKRWTYYRLNSKSHSVPLLAGQNQDPMASSRFLRFVSEKDHAFVLADLTEAYRDHALKVVRGLALLADRRAVLIQDEFNLKTPCQVTWAMTTDAAIKVHNDATALLTLQGKKLLATILAPSAARFSVESAEQKPPQKTNAGVRRLLIQLPAAEKDVRVAVLLSPFWPDAEPVRAVPLKPLSQW